MEKFFIYTLGVSNNIEKWKFMYNNIINLIPFDYINIIHSDVNCYSKESTNQKILFNDLMDDSVRCTSFTTNSLNLNNLESPNIIIDMNCTLKNDKLNIIHYDAKLANSKLFIYDKKVITYIDKMIKINLNFTNPNTYIKQILEKSKKKLYKYWNKKKENDNFFIKLIDFITLENNKIEQIMNDKLLVRIVDLLMDDKNEDEIIENLYKYGKHISDLLFITINDENICTKND